MKNITKAFTLIFAVLTLGAGLCGCADTVAPDKSGEIETRPVTDESTDGENGGLISIDVFGTPLDKTELSEFETNREWADEYVENGCEGEFLDSLEKPEIKELYCKALSLVHIMSTENLAVSETLGEYAGAYLERYDKERASTDRYNETGYAYDSFYNAFLSVFTKETADTLLSRYPSYYNYDGELWYLPMTFSGNIGEVHREYELTGVTDDEVTFTRTSYCVDIGEPADNFFPDKKDEYDKEEVSFRFVKTEDGWRAAEFLNAEKTDANLLMG